MVRTGTAGHGAGLRGVGDGAGGGTGPLGRVAEAGRGPRGTVEGRVADGMARLIESGLDTIPVYRGDEYLGDFTSASLQQALRALPAREE